MHDWEQKDIPVDIMHAESLDTILAQDLLLAAINIPQTNVHQLAGTDDMLILEPAKDILLILPSQPSQESHRHAVDIAAGTHLGHIDIGVSINPDDGHVAAQTLTNGPGSAGDCTDRDGVVAAESEHELAILGVVVDLRAQTLSHGAHTSRLLHAPVVWVFGRDVLLVVVDFLVVVDLVVEVFVQVFEEAGLDQRHGGGFDAFLHLFEISASIL